MARRKASDYPQQKAAKEHSRPWLLPGLIILAAAIVIAAIVYTFATGQEFF